MYPTVPRPATVDTRELLKKDVLTRFNKFGEDTKFKRFAVET